MSSTIGKSLRAARERRGWTREALAYHAGVSWAAVAQIESGRRTDARLSTLSALARALGVSLDHLAGRTPPPPLLDHQALVHGSDEEFLEMAVPFLTGAVERSEAPLAVTTRTKVTLLRKALGKQAPRVVLADSARWYSSPLEALARYRKHLSQSVEEGALWVRIIGEPVWTQHSPAQMREWGRYESMINMSFASEPVTLVCPYDTRTAPRRVVAEAECTHPKLARGKESVTSAAYRDPESFLIGLNRH